MRILRDASPVPDEGMVIAIGNFDGLHLGHQAILAETATRARRLNKTAAVLTFEPHPRSIFHPHTTTLRILSFREKARALAEYGIALLRVVRFTPAFAAMAAETFIHEVLVNQLHAAHVVTGEDFVFGRGREGNASLLGKAGLAEGFGATACAAVRVAGERCSSTRIRAHLAAGEVAEAGQLLGRPYTISGRVRAGDKRGKTLGFPTANIVPGPLFLPVKGVYAVRAQVQGKTVEGVANLGMRPTFGGSELRLETHLFDWNQDIYGERVQVALVQRIREERQFASIEALKAQIAADSAAARRILK